MHQFGLHQGVTRLGGIVRRDFDIPEGPNRAYARNSNIKQRDYSFLKMMRTEQLESMEQYIDAKL